MSKNKNNKPVWGTRINQKTTSSFQKIGSSLKINGDTWKNVDLNRAKKFMTKVRSIRKNA